MASNASGATAEEECRIAMNAAAGVALEHCSDDEELETLLSRMLGIEPDINCTFALEEGLDEDTCTDFEGLRQWVMCRAHDLLKNQQVEFDEALEEAWGEARNQCDMSDAAI